MNFRPWYERLVLNPLTFTNEILILAYAKYRFANPTLEFGDRTMDPKLEFDAGRGRLNGIPFGAGIERLRPFGAADFALSAGDEPTFCLEYSPLGLAVNFEQQSLVSFEISFDSTQGSEHPTKFAPCKGATIRTDGVRSFEVEYSSSPDDLNRIFGMPDQVETADYDFGIERIQFYHLPACRVVASFDARSNSLIHLDLSPARAGRAGDWSDASG